jgi:hypothetical protein
MQNIECEPYLLGHRVEFHSIFTLIDPTMNTSEIKPLHLAVPRNRQGMRMAPANQPNIKKPGAEEGGQVNQRFLSNRYLAAKRSADSAKPQTVPATLTQPAQAIVTAATSEARRPLFSQENANAIAALLAVPNYWLYPLPSSAQISLIFSIEPRSSPPTFLLTNDATGQTLLSAKLNGPTRASGVAIYDDKRSIGEGIFTAATQTLYFGADTGSGNSEASAIVFTPGPGPQARMFDFLVPAIKKPSKGETRGRMFPMPFGDTSSLAAKLKEGSKEAIQLKCRDPGVSGDFTFGGKLAKPSPFNFALYHVSNANKDLCSMTLIDGSRFSLEIGYPLSPLQGFLAALASAVAQ